MRVCRGCGRQFRPGKAYHHYCTWACLLVNERKSEAWQEGYNAGFRAGVAQVHQREFMSPVIWRALMSVAHPDRHQGSPLAQAAHEGTLWLIQHRPRGDGHG